MAASKKAAKKDIGTELRGLVADVETAVGKFNSIHLAQVPAEAPQSAWARRMEIEIKHMKEITSFVEAAIKTNDTSNQDNQEEGQE
tara:strand:+ start:45 stop:302 length:258 start_codon:yes stop_codon:yes gene_type:complete